MARKYNFSAGPAMLPLAVLEKIKNILVDYHGKGYSLLEVSHRDKEYGEVHETTIELVKKAIGLSQDYHVLLLGGGATLQFAMIPLNLLSGSASCDFVLSGHWAEKAMKDAMKIGKVNIIFDGTKENFTFLPKYQEIKIDPKAAYLHLTSNETIRGIQWKRLPDTGAIPLVVDASSDILTRHLPMGDISLLYAGAQKNLGPAGVTLVIVRDDLLEKCSSDLPGYLSYKSHVEQKSLYNTPPVFQVLVLRHMLEWFISQGGLPKFERDSLEKASLIYSVIDRNNGFYIAPAHKECRSNTNVAFHLPSAELEEKFLTEAAENDFIGLKGHRSVGGIRISLYNALPLEGAKHLADFMDDFVDRNG